MYPLWIVSPSATVMVSGSIAGSVLMSAATSRRVSAGPLILSWTQLTVLRQSRIAGWSVRGQVAGE